MIKNFNISLENEVDGIENIRKIEFDILKKFHIFCEENGIRYVLTAGTLLGAVRHGGFIPWDDDIDIAVFRPDYEKLVRLSADMASDCCFLSHENDSGFSRLYGRIVNKNYVSVDKYYSKKCTNYFGIDVFPVEAVPNTHSKNFFKRLKILRQMFIFSQSALFKGNGFLKAYVIKPLPIIACKIIGKNRIYKMFYDTVKKVNYENAENLAVVTGVYSEKESFKKEKYYDIVNIDFEGFKTFCVKDFDEYLKNIFGDYNKLPPQEDRVPHHNYKLYRLG